VDIFVANKHAHEKLSHWQVYASIRKWRIRLRVKSL